MANRIVVREESQKPLTTKRIFETKLRGVPLCMTHDDLHYEIKTLINCGVMKQNNGFVFNVMYPIIVIIPGKGYVDHLHPGQEYTLEF